MDQKTIDMVNRIMDTGRMGYAYVYPSDGHTMGEEHPIGERNLREEYLVATTPENLADFISSHRDAHRITVTDIADRPLLDVSGGFINGNPEPGVRTKILTRLAQLQTGEEADGEVLQIGRQQADAYFAAEDRVVTMAEYGMG